jgi:hypothetical protein
MIIRCIVIKDNINDKLLSTFTYTYFQKLVLRYVSYRSIIFKKKLMFLFNGAVSY